MIKVSFLNLSLSTATTVGAVGGVTYYSKKAAGTNQPLTRMAGVGYDYKKADEDGNIISELTSLLNIDLSSVSDLAKNINQLGGLDNMGTLPSDLTSLTDGEDDEDEVGEGLEEDEEESNDETDDEDEGLEKGQNNLAEKDKASEKIPKTDDDEGANEENKEDDVEVIESTDTETKVKDDEIEITEPQITDPAEKIEETVVSKDPLPTNEELPSETDNTDNTVVEPTEKEEALTDANTEPVQIPPPIKEEETLDPVPTLTEAQKAEQEAAQQAENERLAQIQEDNPSTGIDMPEPSLNGSTLDLSADGTQEETVEETVAPPATEDLTDIGDGVGKGEDLKDLVADVADSTENINNTSPVLPAITPTEIEETASPTAGGVGDMDGSKPLNTSTDSEITQVSEEIKEVLKDIDADPVPGDNSDDEQQDKGDTSTILPVSPPTDTTLTGSGTDPIPLEPPTEGDVSNPEKPALNVVADMSRAITEGPKGDAGTKGKGPAETGSTKELTQPTGEIKGKESTKAAGGMVTSGDDDNIQDEIEEEEVTQEDEAETVVEDDEAMSTVVEEADEDIVENSADDNSSANITTLINSIASSIA